MQAQNIQSSSDGSMEDKNYPALFRTSDVASVKAQKIHLWLQRIYLGSLVLASIVSTLSVYFNDAADQIVYIASAVILAIGLFLLAGMRIKRFDKIWFDCRAIAESAKTTTWRYMMKLQPFDTDDSLSELFANELEEIRKGRPNVAKHLSGRVQENAHDITNFMTEMRTKSVVDRRDFYVNARLNDQLSWYDSKSAANNRSADIWFCVLAGFQLIALILSIIKASTGGLPIVVIPIITTLAAVFLAWNKLKSHDELSQSYALAAGDLQSLQTIAQDVTKEVDFLQLVEETEEAISREHTMWCVKRDVSINK